MPSNAKVELEERASFSCLSLQMICAFLSAPFLFYIFFLLDFFFHFILARGSRCFEPRFPFCLAVIEALANGNNCCGSLNNKWPKGAMARRWGKFYCSPPQTFSQQLVWPSVVTKFLWQPYRAAKLKNKYSGNRTCEYIFLYLDNENLWGLAS